MEIYVGFQSPSILKYLEPLTDDLFMTWFADCIFNEDHFLTLGQDNKFITDGWEIIWDDKSILSSEPCTKEAELQVSKIIKTRLGREKPPSLTLLGADTQGTHNPLMAKKSRNQLVPIKKTPKPWSPITNGPCQLSTLQRPLSEGDERAQ
jgi:hypothetical protein